MTCGEPHREIMLLQSGSKAAVSARGLLENLDVTFGEKFFSKLYTSFICSNVPHCLATSYLLDTILQDFTATIHETIDLLVRVSCHLTKIRERNKQVLLVYKLMYLKIFMTPVNTG